MYEIIWDNSKFFWNAKKTMLWDRLYLQQSTPFCITYRLLAQGVYASKHVCGVCQRERERERESVCVSISERGKEKKFNNSFSLKPTIPFPLTLFTFCHFWNCKTFGFSFLHSVTLLLDLVFFSLFVESIIPDGSDVWIERFWNCWTYVRVYERESERVKE